MKLGAVLSKIPQFNELLRGVSQGQSPFGCVGLSQIHKAHFAAGLYESLAVPAVLVAPDDPSAVRLFEDLSALLPERQVLLFPSKEIMLHSAEAASGEYEFARLGCLEALRHAKPFVVASAEAAMQYTISPEALRERSALLKGSFSGGPEGLVSLLVTAGYSRCEQVEGTCTFATRGGCRHGAGADRPL